MNPSSEQLDKWSAEAMGWELRPTNWDNDQGWWLKDGVYALGHNDMERANAESTTTAWKPSTDLSQAWQEFSPVLLKMNYQIILYQDPDENPECELCADRKFHLRTYMAIGTTLSYALTYGFVQVMQPKSYLEWRKQNESN